MEEDKEKEQMVVDLGLLSSEKSQTKKKGVGGGGGECGRKMNPNGTKILESWFCFALALQVMNGSAHKLLGFYYPTYSG